MLGSVSLHVIVGVAEGDGDEGLPNKDCHPHDRIPKLTMLSKDRGTGGVDDPN